MQLIFEGVAQLKAVISITYRFRGMCSDQSIYLDRVLNQRVIDHVDDLISSN